MSTSDYWRHSIIAICFVISKLFRPTQTVRAWTHLTSFDLYFVKDQIVLSGDSAGGQLTIAIGLHLKQEGLSVKGLVPLYPMTQVLSIHLKSMQTGSSASNVNNEWPLNLETKYMIHYEGVAWSASNYITMDTSLIQAVKSGEVYQASILKFFKFIRRRFPQGGVRMISKMWTGCSSKRWRTSLIKNWNWEFLWRYKIVFTKDFYRSFRCYWPCNGSESFRFIGTRWNACWSPTMSHLCCIPWHPPWWCCSFP